MASTNSLKEPMTLILFFWNIISTTHSQIEVLYTEDPLCVQEYYEQSLLVEEIAHGFIQKDIDLAEPNHLNELEALSIKSESLLEEADKCFVYNRWLYYGLENISTDFSVTNIGEDPPGVSPFE